MTRQTGTVTAWNGEFGFVNMDSDHRVPVFVGVMELKTHGMTRLERERIFAVGDRVEFDLARNERGGPVARNVVITEIAVHPRERPPGRRHWGGMTFG